MLPRYLNMCRRCLYKINYDYKLCFLDIQTRTHQRKGFFESKLSKETKREIKFQKQNPKIQCTITSVPWVGTPVTRARSSAAMLTWALPLSLKLAIKHVHTHLCKAWESLQKCAAFCQRSPVVTHTNHLHGPSEDAAQEATDRKPVDAEKPIDSWVCHHSLWHPIRKKSTQAPADE